MITKRKQNITNQTNVHLKQDECIKVEKIHKESFGIFTLIGALKTMSYPNNPPDIIDILNQLSKGAINLFTNLKLKLDVTTNYAHYPVNYFNNSQSTQFRKYRLELVKAGLIKKAKTADILTPIEKSTYMINPNLIKCREYERACQVWVIL